MGCLIQITYTKKASEKDYDPFFLRLHEKFFSNSVVQSVDKDDCKRYVVRVYVAYHHNSASKYIHNRLSLEKRLYNVRIIS